MTETTNPFGAAATMKTTEGELTYYRLDAVAREAGISLDELPVTVKILLENVLRLHADGSAKEDDVLRLAGWKPDGSARGEFPFLPARVLLQDFTGVPAVVDLAAM